MAKRPQSRRVCVVMNSKAGSARGNDPNALAQAIARPFQDRGDHVEARVRRPAELAGEMATLRREKGFDIIVLCGGDGTLSRCADALADLGVALGFVPLGTMNLFARALRMPPDPAEAGEALAHGREQSIDLARVNGRHYLHHVSFGLHPALISQREKLTDGSRGSKLIAAVRAFFMSIRKPATLRLELEHDGALTDCAAPALVITNNPLGAGHLPFQDEITGGRLAVYICRGGQWAALARVGADVLLGRIADNDDIETFTTPALTIRRPGGGQAALRAAIDGELTEVTLPARVEIVPRALRVVLPGDHAV